MKFSQEVSTTSKQIHSYNDDHIVIRQNNTSELLSLNTSLIITPSHIESDWLTPSLSLMTENDILYLKQFNSELIILASTANQHTLLNLRTQFFRQKIAVEFMSLAAACRSYNLLVLDDRKVLLAIPFESE